MNEHFATNMTGQMIGFAVQPYNSGHGVTKQVTPRRVVAANCFDPELGRTNVEYEVFDIIVTVTEGSEVAGLYCGVPISKPRDLAGTDVLLQGVRYGALLRAVRDGQRIIIARCG